MFQCFNVSLFHGTLNDVAGGCKTNPSLSLGGVLTVSQSTTSQHRESKFQNSGFNEMALPMILPAAPSVPCIPAFHCRCFVCALPELFDYDWPEQQTSGAKRTHEQIQES